MICAGGNCRPFPGSISLGGTGRCVLGDFYDVFRMDEHRWGLALVDVCAHGASAARLTALLRYTLRAAAKHAPDPADAFGKLNIAVTDNHIEPGRFATLTYIAVDTVVTGTIRRASVGTSLVRRPGGAIDRLTGANSRPIGLALASGYRSESISIDPGNIVLLYSDGATGARNHAGEPLGIDALKALVAAAPTEAASSFIHFVADASSHTRATTFSTT